MRTLILALLSCGVAAAPASGQVFCRIDADELNFGTYSSLSPAPETANAAILVRCIGPDALGSPRVTLTTGGSGSFLDRRMRQGGAELSYNLYTDPSRRFVAGDGSASTIALPAPRTRAAGRARFVIFASIPPGQRVPAGSYSDSVLVVVAF